MNELSCNSICQLLCCPPIPSKIAAKLAFMPPTPSYQVSSQTEGENTTYSFTLTPFIKDCFVHHIPDNLEVTKQTTRKGNEIVVLYMPLNSSSKLTFLISHGNAVDLGLMLNFMYELGSKLNVNIMCYDYSGYGMSSGKPLEKHLYADAECALNVLRTKYSTPLEQIVLYGQSIGTVPTVHLATLHRVAAVVLHSPLMSGLRVAFPRLKRNYCCDVFSNLTKAPKICSPTLVIHGTRDDVINISHGYRICSAVAEHLLLDPLFIDGAGHNDCERFPQYFLRLTRLVNVELSHILTFPSNTMSSPTQHSFDETAPEKDSLIDLLTSESASMSAISTELFSTKRSTIDFEEEKSTNGLLPRYSNTSFSKVNPTVDLKTSLIAKVSHSLGSVSPNSSFSSHACSEFVDKVNASLLNVAKHWRSTLTTSSQSHNSESKISLCAGNNPTNLQIVSGENLICPLDFPNSYSREFQNSDLPPPPPPPVVSGCNLLSSNKMLWSLHGCLDRKINTLPHKLIPTALFEKDIGENCLSLPSKVCTLPHDLSYVLVTKVQSISPSASQSHDDRSDHSLSTSELTSSKKYLSNTSIVQENSVLAETKSTSCFYVRAPRIMSPTLIIHGTDDDIIDRMHAQKLFERIPNTLEPLFIRGAGHNDCELYEEYLIRLEYLVHVEVENFMDSRFSNSTEHSVGAKKHANRFSTRMSKLLRRSPKSPSLKSTRVSPSPMNKPKFHELPESDNVSVPTPVLERPPASITPVWMRKRGAHGSYRHISHSKRTDKRKCMRNHSLPTTGVNLKNHDYKSDLNSDIPPCTSSDSPIARGFSMNLKDVPYNQSNDLIKLSSPTVKRKIARDTTI